MNYIISLPAAPCLCAIAGTERLGNIACPSLFASNLRKTGTCGYEIKEKINFGCVNLCNCMVQEFCYK